MLTRSAYILIASVLDRSRSSFGASSIAERNAINAQFDSCIDEFCKELVIDNPRFDSAKFKRAAGYGTLRREKDEIMAALKGGAA